MSHPRRVVVTGMGAVTSLGIEVEGIWEAVLAGRSGVGPIRQFDSELFPVRIGSEVDLEALPPRNGGPPLSRAAHFGLVALDQAWRDGGLEEAPEGAWDPWRSGVCIGGSTFPVVEESLAKPRNMLAGDRFNMDYYLSLCRQRPELLYQRDISSLSSQLAQHRDLRFTSITVQTACASATQAIGESFELIRDGDADLMVTGGTDSMMSALCVMGFTLLGALSPQQGDPAKVSRPFDLKRDGFVIGEGAGIVLLEELEHARARGARIFAEVIGYGSSSDGYRFTDVHPNGLGAKACMRSALESAGIAPEQVGYINAHGTSTPQNDRVESLAIKEVFGDHAHRLPVSSTKSQLGHLVCAAGGIEMIFTVLALGRGMLPPTINLDHPDVECDLDYIPHQPRSAEVEIALSNSFGFGGQNASLLVQRWDGK